MGTTEEDTEAIARQFFEAIDTQDRDLAMELMADDIVEQGADAELTTGKEAYWGGAEAYFFDPFPDFSETVEHVITEDDMAAVRWRYSGTHEGTELYGVPPTGEQVTGTGQTALANSSAEVWLIVSPCVLIC